MTKAETPSKLSVAILLSGCILSATAGCFRASKVNRVTRVVSSQTVNVQSLVGWVVLEQLAPERYVIRNKNLIQEVKMPEWFGRVYTKGDTIK